MNKPTWPRKTQPYKKKLLIAERARRARKSMEDYDNRTGRYFPKRGV